MLEVSFTHIKGRKIHEVEFETEELTLWVNRYPDGHELAGNVKDIRLAYPDPLEGGRKTLCAFVTLSVRSK